MGAVLPRWVTPLVVVGYALASNVALASRSRPWSTVAVLLLVVLLLQAVTHPRWRWLRIAIAVGGTVVIAGIARGSLAPVPLMLPPVVIPASMAWLFGHTLLGGRVPLVVRFARVVNAPEPLDTAHVRYARGVTVMWTWVLLVLAAGNLYLVSCLAPGGLLEQFGQAPRWPVDLRTFLWFSNGFYLVVPLLGLAEFLFRVHRFPDYRLRSPLQFARRARARLPALVDEMRRG
jgi:uncharacterized membrane protein